MPDNPTSPRRRGAPKGNHNARKHGFYSTLLSPSEKDLAEGASPAGKGRLQGDINLFKVLIDRASARLLTSEKELPFAEALSTLHVVSVAVARLNSLVATNKKLYQDEAETMLELDRVYYRCFGLTEAEVDAEIAREHRQRLRGAQPGNRNALKHGFYASLFDPAEIRKLNRLKENELEEEIALLRVLIKRVVASMPPKMEMPSSLILHAMRILTYAVACVEKLERTQSLVFGGEESSSQECDNPFAVDPDDPLDPGNLLDLSAVEIATRMGLPIPLAVRRRQQKALPNPP